MTRKKKATRKLVPDPLLQPPIATEVTGEPFDIVLFFDGDVTKPQLYIGDDVQDVLIGYIQRYKKIILKVNWFDKGLMVLTPDAPQGISEAPGSTEGSNPTLGMDLQN